MSSSLPETTLSVLTTQRAHLEDLKERLDTGIMMLEEAPDSVTLQEHFVAAHGSRPSSATTSTA